MRGLTFNEPRKIVRSSVHDGKYLYDKPGKYYERFCTVYTKYGIVTVLQVDWTTNGKPWKLTVFETIHRNRIHSAEINKQHLNDCGLKWLCTHFIKKVKGIKTVMGIEINTTPELNPPLLPR